MRSITEQSLKVETLTESQTFIQNKSEARRAWRARGTRAAAVPARRRLPERAPILARIPRTGGEDGTVCVSFFCLLFLPRYTIRGPKRQLRPVDRRLFF